MRRVASLLSGIILTALLAACDGLTPAQPTETIPSVSKLTLTNSNANNFSLPENSNTIFIFMLSGTADVPTLIDWAIFPSAGGSAAADFTVVTGTITIPAGQQSAAYILPIDDDSELEGDEVYKWRYMNVSDHIELSSNEFSFTIVDNEVAPGPPVSFDLAPDSFDEDVESIITLNYSDGDSDLATACSVSGLSNIAESTPCACDGSGVCTVGVTGVLNYSGSGSFSYNVTANGDTSNSANSVLSIDTVNDAPVADNVTPTSFDEDTESIVTLSYTDVEGDLATSCSVSNLINVTESTSCSCDEDGICSVGVTGDSDYNGVGNFDYIVMADSQPSNSATATLTIDPVGDMPVAVAISPPAFDEDIESIITLSYTDVDGDLATSCTPSNLSNVTVSTACSCDGSGVCTLGVTGTTNYSGSASFDYTVTANADVSNLAAATLTINSADSAPVSSALNPAAFNEDESSVITLSYVDGDGDLAAACTLSNLSNITVSAACSCDGSGVCTVGVIGVTNYNGAASFDYTVMANALVSNSSSATLAINSVDDAPISIAITPAAFSEDVESIITLSYSDVESDLASSCSLSNLTNITESTSCVCDGAGVCTVGVTGLADYSGVASFDYVVTANSLASNTVSASLTINAVDDAPIASALTPAAFDEDLESIITLSYTDDESDLATACTLSNLSNVTISSACSCDGAGACTVGVTGTANYNGAASFDYTVTANTQASNSAAATLTISAVSDLPIASAITPVAFSEDVESVITLSYADGDSDLATVCTVSALTNVTISSACSCDGSGVCTVGVTGTANYNGAASFDYTVTANSDVSNLVSASLTINNVDDSPIADALTPASFNEDVESFIALSYTDVDGDFATVCSLSNLSNVTLSSACSCNGLGVCTVGVTGSPDYNGLASFDYTVTANALVSNLASASLIIDNVDDSPVANALTPPAFSEDAESIITLSYTDADSDLATSCALSNLSNVTLSTACSCDGSGVCTAGVTGTSNYSGAASFDYTVTANAQASNLASASLTISATNDSPIASAITPAAFDEDVESIITLSYTDADSDLAISCTLSSLSNVTLSTACSCDGSGVCTAGVTGASNYNGAASFDYTVTANAQVSNLASATLTIDPVDDSPVADALTPAAFNEDVESIITLNYSDVESDLATVCSLSSLTNVTLSTACSCDGSGVCTAGVTGTSNYSGVASFDYTVTANAQVSSLASASLTINNVNDSPVANALTPAAFNEDVESIITLSYTDADSDLATSCTLSSL